MTKRILSLLLSLAVMLGLLASVSPVGAASLLDGGHPGGGGGGREAEGLVTAVDATAGTVTIEGRSGSVTLTVNSSTRLSFGKNSITLADVQVGYKAAAKYNRTTLVASGIKFELNKVGIEGTLTAVDAAAGTISVSGRRPGQDVTLTVDANTIIRRNKVSATLADLMVGDKIEAQYNPVSLLVYRMDAKAQLVPLEGGVTAVDPDAGTVTVLNERTQAEQTITFDAGVIFLRETAAGEEEITLADIVVGDWLGARINPVTLVAYREVHVETYLEDISGGLVSVDADAGTVTILNDADSSEVTLNVGVDTVITRLGVDATLAELQAGDWIAATYNPITNQAASITATVSLLDRRGTISAVNAKAGTLTVKLSTGKVVTLSVKSGTVVKRYGSKSALSALKVKDKVILRYNAGSRTAVNINVTR